MKLIELTANKKSFKKVSFNETGVSLIVALRETDDSKNTYNSVGKSLLLFLIHFCFGCNISKDFEEKLNDWEFTLKFTLDGKQNIVTRKVIDKQSVVFNDEDITLTTFKNRMAKAYFKYLKIQNF